MALGTGSSREISIDVSSSNMKMVLGGYNRKTGVVSKRRNICGHIYDEPRKGWE